MTDTRTYRQREHDRFWLEANLELGSLTLWPWDVLEKLKALDLRLYNRLVTGERWLMERSEEYLCGNLPNLDPAHAGWEDWLRLFRSAIEITETHERSVPEPVRKQENEHPRA